MTLTKRPRYRTIYDGPALDPTFLTLYAPGEKRHISIFQDESIFYCGDQERYAYVRSNRMPLRKKGNSQAIHVSDFIVEDSKTGRLALTSEQVTKQMSLPSVKRLLAYDACQIIYPGKNHDG